MARSDLLAPLLQDYISAFLKNAGQPKPPFKNVYSEVKKMMKPLVPANRDIAEVLLPFFRRKKQDRPRRRRPPASRPAGVPGVPGPGGAPAAIAGQ
jgi:hypothetical protein